MAATEARRITLEFEDLHYHVPQKSGQKSVLKGVSGRFRPGHLAAILGPSGAGKTSLLNVLSGFKDVGSGIQGRILVNGRQRNLQEFRKQSCYITQELAMLPLLTVEETLEISACFRLYRKTKKSQRVRAVDEVITILGLDDARKTKVQCLSGGEKKRLSIGVELMNNPPVMFFDEPTSGLDSSASLQVMTHLCSLVQSGRTIIVSIHQPSSRVFQLFDDVYLLSGGCCLYNGPVKDLVSSLSTYGFHCPQYYNSSDFAIEVACKERGDGLEELQKEAENLYKSKQGEFYCNSSESQYISSEDATEHMAMLDDVENGKPCPETPCENKMNSAQQYPISRSAQFFILLRRCTICTNRDLHLFQLRIATHIVVAVLLGLLFYNFGDDADKVFGNFSFLFFNILFIFFASCMPTVLTFPLEAKVFLQEHSNNWYSLTVYYFAKILADLPLQIICPTLFVTISYHMTGQPLEWDRFFMLLYVCILVAILGQTLGNALGALLDIELAVFAVPASAIPMFLLSGFFLQPKDLTETFTYLSTLSYFKYAFEAAIVAIFGYDRERLLCSQPYCHYRQPVKFIEDIGMSDYCYTQKVLVLMLWIFLLQVSLFCTLKWKVMRSKR